jgi:hypothetical protein
VRLLHSSGRHFSYALRVCGHGIRFTPNFAYQCDHPCVPEWSVLNGLEQWSFKIQISGVANRAFAEPELVSMKSRVCSNMGAAEEEILEGYPSLKREQLELAKIFAQAYPRKGRPPRHSWHQIPWHEISRTETGG